MHVGMIPAGMIPQSTGWTLPIYTSWGCSPKKHWESGFGLGFFCCCWKSLLKSLCEKWVAFKTSLFNSEHGELSVSLLCLNSWESEQSQENWVARVLDVLLLCSISGSSGQWSWLKKRSRRCESLFLREFFKLQAGFFLPWAEGGGVNNSALDQLSAEPQFCVSYTWEKINFFPWKSCSFLKLLPKSFQEGEKKHHQIYAAGFCLFVNWY